jgi:predicted membrane-bound mannosyltransferase
MESQCSKIIQNMIEQPKETQLKINEVGNENKFLKPDSQQPTPDFLWLIGCFIITAIAAVFRFWDLTLKPLHHDEGVNGYFLTMLFRDGVYKYDPSNYHGPTLYYISLAFSKFFGFETFSIRASMAVFGVLMVILALFLKKYIGSIGSLAAALFIGLSPGMIYISRYFIHEIFFVFCSFGIVLGILFFIEGRKAGIFAMAAMTLVLLVCFISFATVLSSLIARENESLLWILRIAFFAIEACLVFFVMRMLVNWNDGKPIYLMLASACLALFFATKETAFITIGTCLMACGCVWIWRKIYVGVFGKVDENTLESSSLTWSTFRERLGVSTNSEFILIQSAVTAITILLVWFAVTILPTIIEYFYYSETKRANGQANIDLIDSVGSSINNTDLIILAVVATLSSISLYLWFLRKPKEISINFLILSIAFVFVFLYVGGLFFSSFFTYPEGAKKAFEAYAFWTKTGTGDHTQNGIWAYAKWGAKIELPIFILSGVGILIALIKGKHRFAIFTGFWAFGLFAAYTIIPYKTPWLALSFILPMCIVAGYGINELWTSRDIAQKILAGLLTLTAVGVLGYQTYDLNFVRYDDDSMPYVYAHTQRGFLDLIKEIDHYAEKSGKGKDVTIEIVSPDYWSMPWYTRNYKDARYDGKIVPANSAEMIVAKKGEQDNDIQREYASHYKLAGTYPLRPGVELMLLVRSDLADSGAKNIYLEFDDSPIVDVTPEPLPKLKDKK